MEGPTGALGPGPCPSGHPGELGVTGVFEWDVLVEYRGKDDAREVHNTAAAKFFIDRDGNRLGVRGPGNSDGEYYIPLSDVLYFLKWSGL